MGKTGHFYLAYNENHSPLNIVRSFNNCYSRRFDPHESQVQEAGEHLEPTGGWELLGYSVLPSSHPSTLESLTLVILFSLVIWSIPQVCALPQGCTIKRALLLLPASGCVPVPVRLRRCLIGAIGNEVLSAGSHSQHSMIQQPIRTSPLLRPCAIAAD